MPFVRTIDALQGLVSLDDASSDADLLEGHRAVMAARARYRRRRGTANGGALHRFRDAVARLAAVAVGPQARPTRSWTPNDQANFSANSFAAFERSAYSIEVDEKNCQHIRFRAAVNQPE
jgi:hypothetical protein